MHILNQIYILRLCQHVSVGGQTAPFITFYNYLYAHVKNIRYTTYTDDMAYPAVHGVTT